MIKKDTWYILANGLQTRFRGFGNAGWESKDTGIGLPFTDDGISVNSSAYNVVRERTEEDLQAMVGKSVFKCSLDGKRVGKPFKSGSHMNTVKGIINHPQLNVSAFVFEEDDSYVNCNQCYLAVSAGMNQ